jgi:hypothetical protein
MRNIVLISGKDSLATAIVLRELEPLPSGGYEYIFNNVGAEYPETLEWLGRVRDYLGSLVTTDFDLEQHIRDKNYLPSFNRRYCTNDAKIKQLERLGIRDCIVHIGIRADEDRVGYVPKIGQGITVRYPLRDYHIDLAGVQLLLRERGLTPPQFFYPQLYDLTCELAGHDFSDIRRDHPIQFNNMFSGRSRNNCYFCFYQRNYEWAYLHDTHPHLFERACELETLGGEGFTWKSTGVSLRDLDYDAIKAKRARQIIRNLTGPDAMTGTSCGVMCGK